MNAGNYNTVIYILKHAVTRNTFGEVVESFNGTPIKTKAKVVNLSANRESINNETFYTDTKQITVHLYVDVDDFDHIKIKDKEYRIVSIIPDDIWRHKVINIELINS